MQGARLILDSVIDSTQIWQKGESQNECVSGGKKCLFFGKFGVLCFFETPVLRFVLLPYYQRNLASISDNSFKS